MSLQNKRKKTAINYAQELFGIFSAPSRVLSSAHREQETVPPLDTQCLLPTEKMPQGDIKPVSFHSLFKGPLAIRAVSELTSWGHMASPSFLLVFDVLLWGQSNNANSLGCFCTPL